LIIVIAWRCAAPNTRSHQPHWPPGAARARRAFAYYRDDFRGKSVIACLSALAGSQLALDKDLRSLAQVFAAISPKRPNSAMLCHFRALLLSPGSLVLPDSLVAIRILVTVIPLGMERVSGLRPFRPNHLFTPRAMSLPRAVTFLNGH